MYKALFTAIGLVFGGAAHASIIVFADNFDSRNEKGETKKNEKGARFE